MFGNIAPTLRPAQSPAQPEHRSLLALADDAAGAAATATRPILDLCTGTGDLALAYDRAAARPGADRRRRFLPRDARPRRAQGRAQRSAADRIRFVEADAQQLPFPDDHFQIATVAFGLRNVTDTDRGIAEMVRVTRPGGRVAILEFSQPRGWLFGRLYRFYFRRRAAAGRPGSSRAARTTPTATCPRASWSSPTARRWPSGCAGTG